MDTMRNLRWPDSWLARFALSLLWCGIPAFIASMIVGRFKGLDIPQTMLAIWLPILCMCVVMALLQASLFKPGAPFWRPWS